MQSDPRAIRQSAFSRDYVGGAIIFLVGSGAIYQGMNYKIGSLSRMGAGYFPTAVGFVMVVLGILIALGAKSARRSAETARAAENGLAPTATEPRTAEWRGWLCIIAGNIAFLVLGRYLGLLPATFAMVFIAALGDRENSVKNCLLLALAMSAVAIVVFWWLLRLQFPLLRWG